jgi:hypothetical protein
MNATIYVKAETQNRSLDPPGRANGCLPRRLTGKVPGLARQESARGVLDESGTEPTSFYCPNPDHCRDTRTRY